MKWLLSDFKHISSDDLQVTSSDHNTYNVSQKALGKDDFSKIPSGVNGVQERMQVVWQKCVVGGIWEFVQNVFNIVYIHDIETIVENNIFGINLGQSGYYDHNNG